MLYKRIAICLAATTLLRIASADPSPAWASRYLPDPPGNGTYNRIAIDDVGNIYVAGSINTGPETTTDLIVVKYNTNGTEVWRNRYTGPGGGSDFVTGIALDDVLNFVYVTAKSDNRIRTFAFRRSDGFREVVKEYNNGFPSNSHEPFGMLIDSSRNVYVWGASYGGATTGTDAVLIKYGPGLTDAWVQRVNRHNTRDDFPAGYVDAAGNVTMCGSTEFAVDNDNIILKRFNSAGGTVWENTYAGASGGNDNAVAIARDGSGATLVAGNTYRGAALGPDFVLVKYNSSGVQQWAGFHGSATRDNAISLSMDAYSAIITGQIGTSANIGTVRFDASGAVDWSALYSGVSGGVDGGVHVMTDSDGNNFVTGFSREVGSTPGMIMLKYYGETGAQLWAFKRSPLSAAEMGARDRWGNLFMVGFSNVDPVLGTQPTVYKLYQELTPVPDSYNVPENGSLTTTESTSVLANDKHIQNARVVVTAMPSVGTLSVNATLGTFTYTPPTNFDGFTSFSYKLVRGSVESAPVMVSLFVRHTIQTWTIGTNPIVGGNSTRATFTLSGPAEGAGETLHITESSPIVSVPTTVFVPAGSSTGSFMIDTSPVRGTTPVTITLANTSSSSARSLSVIAPRPLRVELRPPTIVGGASTLGVVLIDGPAPTGDWIVVTGDNSSSVTTPTTATILAGRTSAGITLTSVPVKATIAVTFTAQGGGVSRSATLTVNPA